MAGRSDTEKDLPHPVSIEKVRLVGAIGGQIIMEWVLSPVPHPRWTAAFRVARPRRRGTPVFHLGGSSEPRVLDGGVIRWTVPNSDLKGAVSFVTESVALANAQVLSGPGEYRRDTRLFNGPAATGL